MTKPTLSQPLLAVVMDDGATWEVQTTNYDMLANERYARAHRWPPPKDTPMETMTFLAWHASKREGATTLDYDAFALACLSIDTAAVVIPPTLAVPEGD